MTSLSISVMDCSFESRTIRGTHETLSVLFRTDAGGGCCWAGAAHRPVGASHQASMIVATSSSRQLRAFLCQVCWGLGAAQPMQSQPWRNCGIAWRSLDRDRHRRCGPRRPTARRQDAGHLLHGAAPGSGRQHGSLLEQDLVSLATWWRAAAPASMRVSVMLLSCGDSLAAASGRGR
jgi:hypothetical protein